MLLDYNQHPRSLFLSTYMCNWAFPHMQTCVTNGHVPISYSNNVDVLSSTVYSCWWKLRLQQSSNNSSVLRQLTSQMGHTHTCIPMWSLSRYKFLSLSLALLLPPFSYLILISLFVLAQIPASEKRNANVPTVRRRTSFWPMRSLIVCSNQLPSSWQLFSDGHCFCSSPTASLSSTTRWRALIPLKF